MSDQTEFPLSGRYWTITLLLPFAAVFLAMAAYAVVHGYFAVPEPDAGDGDGASGLLAAMFEGLIWMAAILALEYAVLFRLYPLDLRDVFSWNSGKAGDSVLGGTPSVLAGFAGFVLALMLGRAMAGEDLFAGGAASVITFFAVINGFIIAPWIDLGEQRRRAADGPAEEDIP